MAGNDDDPDLTLRAAWDAYILDLRAANKAPTYIAALGKTYERFTDHLGSNSLPICQVTKADINEWAAAFPSDWSATTRRLRMSHIKTFFRWCYDEEILTANPAERVRLPRARKNPTPLIPDAVVRNLIEFAEETQNPARNRALFLTMLSSGARVAEIAGLTWENVSLEHATIRVRGKGDRWHTIRIEALAVEALREYDDPKRRKPTVFGITPISIRSLLSRLCERHDLPHVAPHMFRVTMATTWRRAHPNGNPSILQDRMGHATYAQTDAYIRRADSMMDFDEPGVLDKLGVE